MSLAKVVVRNHLRELLYQNKNGINLDNPQEGEPRSSQESLGPLLFSIDLLEGCSWLLKRAEGGSRLKAGLLDDGSELVLTHDSDDGEVIATTPGAPTASRLSRARFANTVLSIDRLGGVFKCCKAQAFAIAQKGLTA